MTADADAERRAQHIANAASNLDHNQRECLTCLPALLEAAEARLRGPVSRTTPWQRPGTLIAAEDAPVGVLLRPVRDTAYAHRHTAHAHRHTLERVEIIRAVSGTVVRWVYMSGEVLTFRLGQEVEVEIALEPGSSKPAERVSDFDGMTVPVNY